MGERGRELCGLGRSPYNSFLVVYGDEVVVAAARNVAATNDVAAADVVATVVGDAALVDF